MVPREDKLPSLWGGGFFSIITAFAVIVHHGYAGSKLLQELGQTNKPVFIKRGILATIEEWLTAAGADGLMIEVHPFPDKALDDRPQFLLPEIFSQMAVSLREVTQAIGREP